MKFESNVVDYDNDYDLKNGYNSDNVNVKKISLKKIGFWDLFRYATLTEKVYIIVGVFLSAIGGIGMPMAHVLYSEMTNMLIERQHPSDQRPSTKLTLLPVFGGGRVLFNATLEERMEALLEDATSHIIWNLFIIALMLVCCVLSMYLLRNSASIQTFRIRKQLFSSLMRQDIKWFDITGINNITGKIISELDIYEKTVGSYMTVVISTCANFIVSFVMAFWSGWQLTLAVSSLIPLYLIAGYITTEDDGATDQSKEFEEAAELAEESITHIRTVVAFSGEEKTLKKYDNFLKLATKGIWKQQLLSAFGIGCSFFAGALSYTIVFVYGSQLIAVSHETGSQAYSPYTLVLILFSIWLCCYRLGLVLPLFESYFATKKVASSTFKIIDEQPDIDPLYPNGIELKSFSGYIEFCDVYFNYPSRPEVPVLRGLTLKVQPGEMIAIIGTSGCGKTTILQLLQRFYDPIKGHIAVEGMDVKSVDIAWWRQNIGFVGQEASLFSGTIAENIRLGKLSATQSEIENAARQANAHNFIMKLEKGYSTIIGPGGNTLSGGEKQRIAIARAFIRDPKILLLDEPTSALDAESETVVQAALSAASKGRTTFLVTHRLNTIRSADKIIVLKDGLISEEGTHNQLMAQKSHYFNLVETENIVIKGCGQQLKESREVLNFARSPTRSEPERRDKNDISSEDQIAAISVKTIFSWIRPEISLVICAFFVTVSSGFLLPITSVIYGDGMGAFALKNDEGMLKESYRYAYITLGIAIFSFIFGFTEKVVYGIIGRKLVARLRSRVFSSILKQEIGWFDLPQNHPGRICSRISQDIQAVHSMTGFGFYTMCHALITIVIAFFLSFYYSWKLTLVTATTVPLIFVVFSKSLVMDGDTTLEQQSLEIAGKIAVEALNNKRLITALGLEKYFMGKYIEGLKLNKYQIFKKSVLCGLGFGLGETLPFLGYCCSLAYGAYLVSTENVEFQIILKVSELLIFGAWFLGQSSTLSPNWMSAIRGAKRLEYIFTRVPKITGGFQELVPESFSGDKVRYTNVSMVYPTRPDSMILKDFNLSIQEGQNVAIVGKSGSGKSSVLLLLQRLYSPAGGEIYFHGKNISHMSLLSQRSKLGLVSQEPILFNGSIKYNIEFGDNSRTVPMEDVIQAAKAANIHDFIVNLPEGYDTLIGSRQVQLSGGQKQRVAIARALIRDPSLLLLDEATSALDAESELIVQKTLESASSGRTTITVAHRIGAVINADIIYVVDKGRIAEFGTHEQLISQGGVYSKMHNDKT